MEVVKGDAARFFMEQEQIPMCGLPGDEEDMPEMTHPAPQAAGSGHCTMHPTPLAGHGIQVSPHCSPFAPEEALHLSNYDIQSTGGLAPEELWEEAPEEELEQEEEEEEEEEEEALEPEPEAETEYQPEYTGLSAAGQWPEMRGDDDATMWDLLKKMQMEDDYALSVEIQQAEDAMNKKHKLEEECLIAEQRVENLEDEKAAKIRQDKAALFWRQLESYRLYGLHIYQHITLHPLICITHTNLWTLCSSL